MSLIDFELVEKATSDDFVQFVKETLEEWQVVDYQWRLDTEWAGEVFLHVLVRNGQLQLMQFVYSSGLYEFQNVNEDALKWLKEVL